jgi:hydrogenase nickel incorporation protein HypA/HybF
MHEMSLMENVIDIIRRNARENSITKVDRLKLVVGRLSMALPDSLKFAFEVLSQDDMFQGAILEIEEKDIVCYCPECEQRFNVQSDYCFCCPSCGQNRVDIIEGRELYIDYYEGV